MRKRSEAATPPDPVTRAEELEILAKAEQVIADHKTAPPPLFVSPHKGPGLAPDMERIIETLYRVDALAEYEELEKALTIGEDRGDYGTLRLQLDKAEDRARRAHKLYLSAKLERTRYELDADAVRAAMRQKAIDELELDKKAGRTKRIANDDVDAKMAEMFRDEWRDQAIKRAQVKGMEDALERLADLWKQRCFTLSTLLTTLRK